MCPSDKVPYPSRKVARINRHELEHLHLKKYTIYKCLQCNMFHLATKNTHGKQKKERTNLQRTILSIDRFHNISTRFERLDEKRRRQLSRAEKASKSNRRSCKCKLDKFDDE